MEPKQQQERDEVAGELEETTPEGSVDQAFDEGLEDEAPQTAPESNPSADQRVVEAERQALQARAELENFRKRMQRDSELQLKYANMPLLRDLLEVVDNLRRATDAAQGESANSDSLRQGVEMVLQQLAGVLDKYGCKQIQSLGAEFDPNYHEAIAQMPSEEHPAGHVAQEVAVGYRMHDRVVRPSNVIVSTGPAESQSSE